MLTAIKHRRPLLLICGLLLAGCDRLPAQMGPPPMPAPEVEVSYPVQREVRDYEDFPGRMVAVNSVEIRAHVTGYLEKVHFREGTEVKKGDLLFELDARPYKADLARAEGSVVQSEGHLRRLEADYQRATTLLPRGAIGREDFDKTAGDRTEAVGALAVARASRDMAKLNVDYTEVRAPLSGRISSRYLDPGNMIKADDTVLTTIVSLDPIYAVFDLDERTTIRLQRLIREKKIKWSMDSSLPIQLGLADEDGFPREGTINFADNRVDPDTGTWRLRGLFKNADDTLSPGMFVRIRLPIGTTYPAILISEKAISTDQGHKSVYVVKEVTDKDGAVKRIVEDRRIKVGRLHDGLRVVLDNLTPRDLVVVSGLQRIRKGMEVAHGAAVPMRASGDTEEFAATADAAGTAPATPPARKTK